MTTIEQAKQVSLLDYVQREYNVERIGTDKYRVNPCPVCNGRDHFTIYPATNSYSSFSNCCQGGSILDYVIEVEGAESLQEAIEKITGEKAVKKASAAATAKAPEQKYDFTYLVEEAAQNETQYYFNRGLSPAIVQKYKLGYFNLGLSEIIKQYPDATDLRGKIALYYRYILPIFDRKGKATHLVTRIDDTNLTDAAKEQVRKNHNLGGKNAPFFNENYLHNPDTAGEYIFITEGIFDALSAEEIGYDAISLNSVKNAKRLTRIMKSNQHELINKTFLIAGDNDKSGNELVADMKDALKGTNLTVEAFKIPSEHKDLNDFLKADRDEFEAYTKRFIDELALKDTAYAELSALYEDISNGNFQKPIKTCFPKLNEKLGGGLYPGFYVLGAISSLGKTTMVQQIADGLAVDGEHVLFFSLEMGKRELISKSLTREMAQLKILKKMPGEVTATRKLMNGDIKDHKLLSAAVGEYGKYAKNLFIYEGNFNTTVDEIRSIAEKHINKTGKNPVIIVDYLQILTPVNERMTDKQANDKNVAELKRMSRDLNTPVVAISSFNRENYNTTVSFSSFKESGAIEYSADCVIGLELEVVRELAQAKDKENERREQLNKAKEENPRRIRLVILKNRNGASYGETNYKYYPQINKFDEQ